MPHPRQQTPGKLLHHDRCLAQRLVGARDPDTASSHDGLSEPQSARDVPDRVFANEGGDISAHEILRGVEH